MGWTTVGGHYRVHVKNNDPQENAANKHYLISRGDTLGLSRNVFDTWGIKHIKHHIGDDDSDMDIIEVTTQDFDASDAPHSPRLREMKEALDKAANERSTGSYR